MVKSILIGIALCAIPAWAADLPVATVKTVTGTASVTTANSKVVAVPGTPVYQGSLLQTGPNGSLGITFRDETIMSLGANTQLSVDEYLYAPAQGKLKLSSKIVKGSLNYISGVIAKLQPEAVSISTPDGVIGVRGTQFLVKVEE